MRHFTIFDKKTGDVVRSGTCSNDEDIHLQAGKGESMVPDVKGCTIGHKVNLKTKRLNKRPESHVKRYHKEHADHAAKAEAISSKVITADVLIELFRSKGMELHLADIAAAKAKVAAK